MMQSIYQLPAGWLALALMAAMGCLAFLAGRGRAQALLPARLHSRPNVHGYVVAMWALLPMAIILLLNILIVDFAVQRQLASNLAGVTGAPVGAQLDQMLQQAGAAAHRGQIASSDRLFTAVAADYGRLAGMFRLGGFVLAMVLGVLGIFLSRRAITPTFRARAQVEKAIQIGLFMCAAIAIATTVGIVLSLFFETVRFFNMPGVSVTNFLFGTEWNAQTNDSFGAVPLFFGTFMIALIAMCVAAPVGLYAAIYLSEYASPRMRSWAKPVLEVLAGIPTVVYGFFALLVVAPLIRSIALGINGALIEWGIASGPVLAAQPTSALAAGLVMGIMIIPFVSSLSDDVINAVPQTLRDGAYAMGATPSETVKQVVLPAALPGIIAAMLLAVSRAIGETMIVVMAAGQRAQISMDPSDDLTTITVQIVALLTGDSEFDSPKTLSAFALGFVLFLVTLVFNLIALRVVSRYREKYD